MVPLERHFGAKTMIINNFGEVRFEDPKDFTETFKDFCFSSLFIKEEVKENNNLTLINTSTEDF